jgi:glycosyltransferase involved in cell wall biosynthesis
MLDFKIKMMKNQFSIVILTYNEEESLLACLDSVKWCDIVVI